MSPDTWKPLGETVKKIAIGMALCLPCRSEQKQGILSLYEGGILNREETRNLIRELGLGND
jgi:hypothetical protein